MQFVDLTLGVQSAVFTRLDGGLDPALSTVFVHVPQDTRPPMTVIGAMSSDNEGSAAEQGERITFEVINIYRGASRAPLLTMMHGCRQLLDGQSLSGGGIETSSVRFLRSEISDGVAGHPDGITYAGIQTFEVMACPA